jgi:hypothetical protein
MEIAKSGQLPIPPQIPICCALTASWPAAAVDDCWREEEWVLKNFF